MATCSAEPRAVFFNTPKAPSFADKAGCWLAQIGPGKIELVISDLGFFWDEGGSWKEFVIWAG